MKCPKCGAENPDSAEFCSLCMEQMVPGSKAPPRTTGGAPGDVYLAPGEWRGDAETLRPEVSKVVVAKMHKFRVKMVIYGVIVAAIVAFLVLSFTVWGNPSPGKRAGQLLDAANARNEEAFVDLFQEQEHASAREMYDRVTSYLGGTGRYDVKMKVDQPDNYDAVSRIESGTIRYGSGSTHDVNTSDRLMIVMENHEGRWYVVLAGTDIIP